MLFKIKGIFWKATMLLKAKPSSGHRFIDQTGPTSPVCVENSRFEISDWKTLKTKYLASRGTRVEMGDLRFQMAEDIQLKKRGLSDA